MSSQTREIKYFFFSHYFSDGLRITFGILLPALFLAHFNQIEAGLTLSLGALCVSITDSPGPVIHKRNGMLYCNLFIFVVALATGYAHQHVLLMGLEVLLFSFLFSMFPVYGNRAGALGTAALLVMILMMDTQLEPAQVPGYSAQILAGGVWYMLLSLLFFKIRPYRQAQQALGECIHEVAKFLKLKAAFYNTETDLEKDYHKLVAQQVVVSEKQDAVRELLFKSRLLVKESTRAGRVLVLTFVDVVDLYEQITTIHYDYALLRERFAATGVLGEISRLIEQIAEEIDHVGFAIQSNTRYKSTVNLHAGLEELKTRIDQVGEHDTEGSNLVLKKILVNLRSLVQRLDVILQYYKAAPAENAASRNIEYARFVTHQGFDLKTFRNNLTFSSVIFKHSFRVALVCLFGFTLTKVLDYGHHSYWVLLTIIVILKPGFSLTKQRNFQRITGTLVGGLIGILIMVLIKDKTVLFVLVLLFMVGSYSFQRMNYVISVIFTTPFVLLLFNLLGAGEFDVAKERIIDTLIGSVIAFTASYLLFPSWESATIKDFMRSALKANMQYLLRLGEALAGRNVNLIEYKLARKEVYVSSANLSAAFQRMLSEPKRKQRNSRELHKFVVLNHILSSNIASVATTITEKGSAASAGEHLRPIRRSLSILNDSLKKIDPETPAPTLDVPPAEPMAYGNREITAEDIALKDQLDFIQKVSTDICRISDYIFA
jgi:uncharacterized membrane protein (TIGR01666 family)